MLNEYVDRTGCLKHSFLVFFFLKKNIFLLYYQDLNVFCHIYA